MTNVEYSVREFAMMHNLSRQRVAKLISDGKLRARKIPRGESKYEYRIPASEVDDLKLRKLASVGIDVDNLTTISHGLGDEGESRQQVLTTEVDNTVKKVRKLLSSPQKVISHSIFNTSNETSLLTEIRDLLQTLVEKVEQLPAAISGLPMPAVGYESEMVLEGPSKVMDLKPRRRRRRSPNRAGKWSLRDTGPRWEELQDRLDNYLEEHGKYKKYVAEEIGISKGSMDNFYGKGVSAETLDQIEEFLKGEGF